VIGVALLAIVFGAASTWSFFCAPAGAPLATLPAEVEVITATGGRARILFGGDTHFGESYLANARRAEIVDAHGYGYPTARLAPLLGSADLAIVNLETPLTLRPSSPLSEDKAFVHWGDPERAPAQLAAVGVHAVSLANNHAFDFLKPGLDDTLAALAAHDIAAFGAGATLGEAAQVFRRDLQVGQHSLRLAVIGTFQYDWSYWRLDSYAEDDEPGTYGLRLQTIAEQIGALKAADPTLFVIVFPHWGINYRRRTARQIEQGHALIDAGADLIVGHGSHAFQAAERYAERWILYSIGNFVFLTGGRYGRNHCHPYSLAACLDVVEQPDGLAGSMRLYFIASDNRATNYQPRLLEGAELEAATQLFLAGDTVNGPTRAALAEAAVLEPDEVAMGLTIDLGPIGKR